MSRTFASLFLVACSASWAASADVRVLGAFLFANLDAELTDPRGRTIGDSLTLDPPVSEYRRLRSWHGAEGATSPDRIDVIAVVENSSSTVVPKVRVRFSIFGKVGEMKAHESSGLTDIERGLETARWARRPAATRVVDLGDVQPGAKRSVVMHDFDVAAYLWGLQNADSWAYELKARASAECEKRCDEAESAETSIEVMPRD